jgi:Sap, sulfolipid-1-addressing protein
MVAKIVVLALGAAFFPALLACVAILISRPEPRRLILAFYLGGLLMSVAAGVAVTKVFEDGGEIAGSDSGGPHGNVSIVVGLVGLLFAWLLASRRGRHLIDSWRARHPPRRSPKPKEGPSWVERRLDRATAGIAFLVGAAINLPGPFYLLALGDIATGPSTLEQVALILLFNAIMFLLLEIPLVGYLIDPDWTERAVAATRSWLTTNRLRVLGALIGVISLGVLVQGLKATL